jgi:protein CpxP
MKKIITAVAVAALGVTLAVAAPHGGKEGHGRGRHGGHHGEFGERMAEKLNLSDAQKQQIKDIRQSSKEQNKAFFESFHATMKQFHEAKKADDTAKVESLRGTMEAQRTQMQAIRKAERDRILAILTPDQRAKFEAMKAEREQRMNEKRGERGEMK